MLTALRRSVRGWAGVARSVRTYHGDLRHLAALEAMLRPLVPAGALAFDVGAHVGDRTRVLSKLGARVVAVEPQPRPARLLRLAFARSRRVTVVAVAVGAAEGRLVLRVNGVNPTVSTASTALVDAAAGHPNWRRETWDEVVVVPATTLDALIATHGEPHFVKIDVEGLEDAVLAGLSSPVPVLSFEFTTVQRQVGLAALRRAVALGYRHFNLSLGESHCFDFPAPVDAATVEAALFELPDAANSGDIYAWRSDQLGRNGRRSS